jgi:LuxR family maltose regulon positive regulatory protein
VGLGDVLREWNDLDGAEHHLMEGIVRCELGGYARYLRFGYIALARVKGAQGDADAMAELIHKAQQVAERTDVKQFIAQVAAYRARLCLAPLGVGGRLASATQWARTCGLSVEDQPVYTREIEYLTLARVLIAQVRGAPDRITLPSVLMLLTRLLEAAETAGRIGSVIEILALQALALQAGSPAKMAKAIIPLERALTLAEPEGYVRLFVDEGAPMLELLRSIGSRGVLPDYVARLLAAFGDVEDGASTPARVLAEPLSERELQVLRLLAAGLSNREIAEELFIATSTVNTHTNNIYNKLGVRSRTQAVALAREWNIL